MNKMIINRKKGKVIPAKIVFECPACKCDFIEDGFGFCPACGKKIERFIN
jgi:rRNA maturation endonuclease Nob1